MSAIRIKKGDNVQIIAGKDKGKEWKVLAIDPKKGTVIVEGANMITKHTKPSASNQQGGIITREGPINISNVMFSDKGKVSRIGYIDKDGKKVRVAKATGKILD